MKVRFTHHAKEKFSILRQHGVDISKKKVENTIKFPEYVDRVSRKPQIIFQSTLTDNHVLRVVCRKEGDIIIVITFYPGRKSAYETEK